jgi:hypothetical protein
LLLHADNNFIDTSSANATIVNNGATINTTIAKFGAGSINFASQSISTPSNTNYSLGSTDFTIEMWIRPSSATGIQILCGRNISSWSWYWALNNGTIYFEANSTNAVSSASGLFTVNNWTHLALSRNANTIRIFSNGNIASTLTVSAGLSLDSSPSSFIFGNVPVSSANYWFNGQMDDIRFTKGIARYIANFTPPIIAPFPDNV